MGPRPARTSTPAGTGSVAYPAFLRTDVTLSAGSADDLAAAARDRVADGFWTLKIKVGTDAATDVARVRAVRDAVGPDVTIRLDANQGWTPDEAVTVIRALEDADLGVEFVEQPVLGEDVEGLARVRARVGLPVMADEALFTLVDLDRIIRLQAANLVNVKLAKCGSLGVALEQLRRATDAGVGTMVGSMMETAIGVGAAAAVAAAHPTTVVDDLDAAWWTASSPVVGGIGYEGDRVVTTRLRPAQGSRGSLSPPEKDSYHEHGPDERRAYASALGGPDGARFLGHVRVVVAVGPDGPDGARFLGHVRVVMPELPRTARMGGDFSDMSGL